MDEIHSNTQLSRPVDSIFGDFSSILTPYMNAEDLLLSKTIKAPLLQFLANDFLSEVTRECSERQVADLLQVAKDLDDELSEWAKHVPAEWTYSVAMNLKPATTVNFIPCEVHNYPDFYVARVWNYYRVSRLIIQSVILRLTPYERSDQETHSPDTEKLNCKLVNDICASAPFLLGYNIAELKRHPLNSNSFSDNFLWPQISTSEVDKSLKHTGRISLIWPLHVSSSVLAIPDCQRRWMRAQLQWIAEQDEPQSKHVCKTQSQVLLGRAEDFRFDCV